MSILNKEKILEQARLFVDEGRYDKAIKEYEKILLADPADMRVKLRIAELHVKRKQVADAIRVYREVAVAYTQEGFYLKAVTVYKNILRLNPSMMEINEYLADLYEKMGLVEDAVRQYDIYAAALENKGDINHVMRIRKKIVELSPDSGTARVRLAELYQREGKGGEAIDQYEEYARRLEKEGGDEARLIEMYEKILTHRGVREDMLRGLVRIYYGKGEIKKALKWLEFAKTLTPVDTELLGMQAEIYASLHQLETSRSKFTSLADLHREKGEVDKAVEALARVAVLMPSEEERAERRAQEMGPDAVDAFKAIVKRMRKDEMEEQEEEVTERAQRPEEKSERKPEKKPEVIRPEQTFRKPAVTPAPEEPEWDRTVIVPIESKKPTEEPKAPAKPAAKPAVSSAPQEPDFLDRTVIVSQAADPELMKKAKSAYDLGNYYKQLGLEKQAVKEYEHARDLYKELIPFSAEAAARYSELRVKVSGGTSPKNPAKKTAPKQ